MVQKLYAQFFLVGRHLESMSQTELLVELNLTLGENITVNFGVIGTLFLYQIIMFTSQVRTLVQGPKSNKAKEKRFS